MKYKQLTHAHHYVIRIQRGEEAIAQISKFCQEQRIHSGSFHGIGACDKAVLGLYNVSTKDYIKTTIDGEHEITSLTGIVSDKKIHAHGTVSDRTCNILGGHVYELRISATCEIHLVTGKESLRRAYDEETGLELLDI